ncbi:MAG: hypothetical protein CMD08_01160 [Flavobacteriales bacterium]|nr:hypothetical protein [Flavobacteriales bacterium]
MKKLLIILLFPSTTLISQTSHIVNAGMMYFNPYELNINIGDTIHWINDGGNHNVNFNINTLTGLSFNNPETFVSTPTTSMNIYSHIFTISGTYNYDCSVYGHASSGMTGKIIVNNINSINEQSYAKKIIKIIDLLGKETKHTNQPLFYLYDDGTVEKKITLN